MMTKANTHLMEYKSVFGIVFAERRLCVCVSVIQIFHWQFLAFVKSFWGIEAGQSEWNWGNMKTFVEDKLCPGQTRHNVNNLQIVKLLPIFLAKSQIVITRLQNVLITESYRAWWGDLRTGETWLVTSLSHGAWDEWPTVIMPRGLARDGAGARWQVTIGAGESGSEPPVRERGNHSVGDWRSGGVVPDTQ